MVLINDHYYTRDHVTMTYYPSRLHKAVIEQDHISLLHLLSTGLHPDTNGCIGNWIRGACVNKRTALHCAAQRGDIRSIVILLMGGADPNCKDEDGYGPLHYVCQQYPGNIANKQLVESVEALIDYGAHVRSRTSIGHHSPVELAERYDNNCCVQLLNKYCKLTWGM